MSWLYSPSTAYPLLSPHTPADSFLDRFLPSCLGVCLCGCVYVSLGVSLVIPKEHERIFIGAWGLAFTKAWVRGSCGFGPDYLGTAEQTETQRVPTALQKGLKSLAYQFISLSSVCSCSDKGPRWRLQETMDSYTCWHPKKLSSSVIPASFDIFSSPRLHPCPSSWETGLVDERQCVQEHTSLCLISGLLGCVPLAAWARA